MKRISRNIAFILSYVFVMGLLGGCGQKLDAASYLKAYLDNAYKRNSETIVDAGAMTETEALQIRKQILDAEMSKMANAVDMTVVEMEGLRDNLEDVLFRATYRIGEAVQQPDGSYAVTVTYEQANIYVPILSGYRGQLNTLTNSWSAIGQASDEQMAYDKLVVLESIIGPASISTSFDAPQTMTVRVEMSGESFRVNAEDFYTLNYYLFDNQEAGLGG